MDAEQVAEAPWLGAGVFRSLLHKVDFDGPPMDFHGQPVWFAPAPCRCPVVRLWGDTAAGRLICPDCASADVPAAVPPIPRGSSDA